MDDINFQDVQKWLLEYKQTDSKTTQKQLQNLIVIACLPLVKRISHGLARRSTDPVEDIVQIGSVGLMKAIRLYNPKISTNFKTYATYLITGEIKHYLRDKAAMIKAPREIQELAFRISLLTNELTEKLGDTPTDNQIAKELDVPVDKVTEVIDNERRKNTLSLDQVFNSWDDYSQVLGEKIADENYENIVSLQENKIMLANAIKALKPEYRKVIELNYFSDLKQREIAQKMNVSQMQVSRMLKKALKDLFCIITNKAVSEEVF